MQGNSPFESTFYVLTPRIACYLSKLPEKIKSQTEEIRLRAEKPLSLTVNGISLTADMDGEMKVGTQNPFIVSCHDVSECYKMLCNHSVYSHADQLKNGYITMPYGHRAGIGADFSGEIPKNISSVNIRIAREIPGAADYLAKNYINHGVLIAGPPGCGKTTVLRDLIRQLSQKNYRIAVIDERCEITASVLGIAQNNVGPSTDILLGLPKHKGIEMALRTLSPQIMAFDEIGTENELIKINECMNAGVCIITTCHAGNTVF